MIYLFEISQAKNEEFGLEQYKDRLCIIFESGDPGGEPGEFETFFSESISEWCGFDPEVVARQVNTVDGSDSTFKTKCVYEIDDPGEPEAGIEEFADTVTVLLESSDPGGDPGDFVEHIKLALSSWYVGAKIKKVEPK